MTPYPKTYVWREIGKNKSESVNKQKIGQREKSSARLPDSYYTLKVPVDSPEGDQNRIFHFSFILLAISAQVQLSRDQLAK